MKVEFISPFLDAVINVLNTMASTEASPKQPFVKKDLQAMGDVTGMIGMAKIFTTGAPNPPPILDIATLLVPQGWAIKGIQTAMSGGSFEDVLFTFGGMLAWSVVFFLIGNTRFSKRFA